MPSVSKIFRFLTDTEGFVSTPAGVGAAMGYWGLHKTATSTHRLGSVGGGIVGKLAGVSRALKTTRLHNGVAGNCYWEWSGTWQDLGVPAGMVVTACQGDYIHRWHLYGGRLPQTSNQEWAAATHKSGPFELRSSGGILTGTFSATQDVPARGPTYSAGMWATYPSSGGVNTIDDAVMPGWAWTLGTNLVLSQASSTAIKLRLNSYLGTTDNADACFVRLKQGRVALTVTYASPAGFFFNYF